MGDFRHYNLVLTGVAQRVSDALPAAPSGPRVGGYEDTALRTITLQADDGNTNPIYVGGDSTVTAAVHGIRIPSPVTGIPDPPIILGGFDSGPLKLSKLWVIGTLDEILNITGIEF